MTDNRFVFDANKLVNGLFPRPPGLSLGASELLNRFLLKAVGASARLHVLDHVLSIAPTQELEGSRLRDPANQVPDAVRGLR